MLLLPVVSLLLWVSSTSAYTNVYRNCDDVVSRYASAVSVRTDVYATSDAGTDEVEDDVLVERRQEVQSKVPP